ncbi:hypothetical protein LCGC14_1119020 [marine sediment metagenome]|uniref:Lipoprotein n=1 Tax=marine sediment metagenome TaxID=412755 RepID=A0A0F9QAE6_9ZZZZ
MRHVSISYFVVILALFAIGLTACGGGSKSSHPSNNDCDDSRDQALYACFDDSLDERDECWITSVGSDDFVDYFLENESEEFYSCWGIQDEQFATCVNADPETLGFCIDSWIEVYGSCLDSLFEQYSTCRDNATVGYEDCVKAGGDGSQEGECFAGLLVDADVCVASLRAGWKECLEQADDEEEDCLIDEVEYEFDCP